MMCAPNCYVIYRGCGSHLPGGCGRRPALKASVEVFVEAALAVGGAEGPKLALGGGIQFSKSSTGERAPEERGCCELAALNATVK